MYETRMRMILGVHALPYADEAGCSAEATSTHSAQHWSLVLPGASVVADVMHLSKLAIW